MKTYHSAVFKVVLPDERSLAPAIAQVCTAIDGAGWDIQDLKVIVDGHVATFVVLSLVMGDRMDGPTIRAVLETHGAPHIYLTGERTP